MLLTFLSLNKIYQSLNLLNYLFVDSTYYMRIIAYHAIFSVVLFILFFFCKAKLLSSKYLYV